MNRWKRVSGLGLSLLLVPTLSIAGEVTLSGEGSVRYQPDSARLQFTASAEHEMPQQATEQVAAMMSEWREAISQYQDRLQDYTDATVNLYNRTLPGSERGEEPQKRAVASQTVTFHIDDLSLLNPLLEQAQSIGLNYNLGPSQFFHSDEAGLEQEALSKAIANAQSRCEFVAQQLQQSCGDVVTISINGDFRPVPMMMAEAKGSADTVSSVGVREVHATVNATFELD
ncbi:SIMPL domain-containing protein [Marinobacter sp. M216]|uniref:SIMPL domain-containing protein n=1 Tax=Marinobacter albus TaxID=3030833 RepID=A0ABT7HAH4_9GAMM|nr:MULTISPECIES: SIMPL domain-containing protein [unclassified Marinobacter]MBW7470386.1 SIMPL domain-containing protein [Marinobacter sp. F4218]MDK9557349.1 SIMPL domain-containing protein [Marinobacter sp. M216]